MNLSFCQAFVEGAEVKHLVKLFNGFAKAFLKDLGLTKGEVAARWREANTFFWASVAVNGGSHLPHSHPDASVSGIYYAQIPQGSGRISFEDPRGALPPFDNRLIHQPEAGQILVFPSWLLHPTPSYLLFPIPPPSHSRLIHHVGATTGGEARISFSFNAPGSWKDTADISTETTHESRHKGGS